MAVSLLLPLTFPVTPQPLMSLPRFLAVLFPIFMWLAVWCEERRATDRVVRVSAASESIVVHEELAACDRQIAKKINQRVTNHE